MFIVKKNLVKKIARFILKFVKPYILVLVVKNLEISCRYFPFVEFNFLDYFVKSKYNTRKRYILVVMNSLYS